jgi:hypothetical protein
MMKGRDIEKLNAEDDVNMALRPYVSLLGTLLIFVAIATILCTCL